MTTLLQQIEIAKLNKVNIAPVIEFDLPQIAAKNHLQVDYFSYYLVL